MKNLLQLLKNEEITIDLGNVQQSLTVKVDNENYFEILLTGFLHHRDNTGSEHEYPSSLTRLEAEIHFSYLVINSVEYDKWTDEQKLFVYEILKEKFEGQFHFVELNY